MRYLTIIACCWLVSCTTKQYGTPYYSNNDKMSIDVDMIDSNSSRDLDELLFGDPTKYSLKSTTPVSEKEPTKVHSPINQSSSEIKSVRADSIIKIVIDVNINDERMIRMDTTIRNAMSPTSRVPMSIRNTDQTKLGSTPTADTVYSTVYVTDTVRSVVAETVLISEKTIIINQQTIEDIKDSTTLIPPLPTAKKEVLPVNTSDQTSASLIAAKKQASRDSLMQVQLDRLEADLAAEKVKTAKQALQLSVIQNSTPDTVIISTSTPNEITPKRDSMLYLQLNYLQAQLAAEKAKTASQLRQLNEIQSKTITVVETDTLVRIIKESNELKKFIFYFDLGNSTARNEQAILDSIASFDKNQGNIAILLAGYTDASGPADKNMKLSKTRTDTVKKQLMQKGVNPQSIFVQYFGEEFASAEKNENDRRVECTVYRKE